ncbi:MAG TPA: cyclic nucleotide-binding domain-containing protein [Oligoflexia bacterium]|nr:cyclic nucleotide-binding domain-containing protein [Oligoflexia bacterium]
MDEKLVEYKKGDVLFHEGENSKDLYIVQTGVVKIFKECDGRKLPIALVHAGQFVGELSFFDGKPRSASAECATDAKILTLNQAHLEREMKKLPSWLLVMIRSIADRMRDTDEIVKRNRICDKTMEQEFSRWGDGQPK